MREICFDTETTGFDPDTGDRLVEIGAVELINHLPTGKIYHEYINPERDVPEEVVKVHGLDNEFLKDKPIFRDVAQSWVDFIGDDGILVAHNAALHTVFFGTQNRCNCNSGICKFFKRPRALFNSDETRSIQNYSGYRWNCISC